MEKLHPPYCTTTSCVSPFTGVGFRERTYVTRLIWRSGNVILEVSLKYIFILAIVCVQTFKTAVFLVASTNICRWKGFSRQFLTNVSAGVAVVFRSHFNICRFCCCWCVIYYLSLSTDRTLAFAAVATPTGCEHRAYQNYPRNSLRIFLLIQVSRCVVVVACGGGG